MKSIYNALDYNKLVSFIWSVADTCLRDRYNRGKYRDVILPMTVLRRFDTIIENRKEDILREKAFAEENGLDIAKILPHRLGLPFYNISQFSLRDLKHETNKQNLKKNFEAYIEGFSDNIKDILKRFNFHTQIDTMTEHGILGSVIEKFTSIELNLSPYDQVNSEGEVIRRGLDNHAMGTLFEELLRKFNEENNEEAGEHFTPRDAVELVADLAIMPILDKVKEGTYTIYDGACGTLGMATVAAERLKNLMDEQGKEVSLYISGQEVNPETYAISKADLLIRGGDTKSNQIFYGSTLSNDGTRGQHFDFMLSNPPYGKDWGEDIKVLGGTDKDAKNKIMDSRFVIPYKENPEFRMLPDKSDGQLLFLLNNISKMKDTELGSRIVEVHNGSALFTGDAGNGASNARRFMIESDLVEAIIQLPDKMFYNTPISTHIWVLSNRKEPRRKGKIQLIDASSISTPLRKNLGQKNCELSMANRQQIMKLYSDFEENEYSKIFNNEEFGFYQITVQRPLRQAVLCNRENIAAVEDELESLGVLKGEFSTDNLGNGMAKTTAGAKKELGLANNMSAYVFILGSMIQEEAYLDYKAFEKEFNRRLKKIGIKGTSFSKFVGTGLATNMIIRDERAAIQKNSNGEITMDNALNDTENVPLTFPGGIEAFMEQEVLPYHPDAVVDESKTIIGYELSFTKYFYKPKELESVESIVGRIRELEKQAENAMASILEGLYE